jgi:hypothetical protein
MISMQKIQVTDYINIIKNKGNVMNIKTGKNIEWKKSQKYITLIISLVFLTLSIINFFYSVLSERVAIFQFFAGVLGLFIYLRLVLIPKIRISEDKLEIATSHFRTKTLLPNEIVNIDYNENEIIITTTNNNNIKISKNEIELANFETLTQDLSNFKMV